MRILAIGYIIVGFGASVGILVQAPNVFNPNKIALLVVTSLIVLLGIALGMIGVLMLMRIGGKAKMMKGESRKGWIVLVLPSLVLIATGWALIDLVLAGVISEFFAYVGSMLSGIGIGLSIGQMIMRGLLIKWVRDRIKEVEPGGKG